MATTITESVFRQLLTVISEWYEKRGYTNMLKVLYRDLLTNNFELNKATKVMDLMDMLMASGHLHSTNLNLLYDTINITKQYGLERRIKYILPTFQNVKDVVISIFTHHRQKVMRLGMVLIDDEVKQISGLYNKPVKQYPDTWTLIMDLEHNMIICEGTMDAFIEELNKLELQQAVEALTEGAWGLDVSDDEEPIEQSPMIIKVETEKLDINTGKYCSDVVKCEDDCLLVSGFANEVLKYKQSGAYIGKVTLPNYTKVYRMYNMKNGNIVFSGFDGTIKICNMNGQVMKIIGEGVLSQSWGIHVDETSNVLYVAGGSNCVYMFDMKNGQTIKTILLQDIEEYRSVVVTDVTLTNQGHLLVIDRSNVSLHLYDTEGMFIKVLVQSGNEGVDFRTPEGIVVDEDDNIIISSDDKLQLFSRDGNFIKMINNPEDGTINPKGLCIISYHPRRLAVANADMTVRIYNY